MRGFSLAMSHIIFFIATLVALSIAVSAVSVALKGLSYAMAQKTEVSAAQIATIVRIVEGGGNLDQNLLWVYVKNLGETTLDVNYFDVFINGSYVGGCNTAEVNCADESSDFLLTPGEMMEVNVNYPLSPGSYRVRIVTENGVYTDYEVVVG